MPTADIVSSSSPQPAVRPTGGTDGEPPEIAAPSDTVVRPVLALLFRAAVGPRADRYAPRFLAFERAGRVAAGWHWPSLLVPTLWAFYRRLWVPGICVGLARLATIAAFVLLAPSLDDVPLEAQAAALAIVLLLPGVLTAVFADWLLYRRVRALVRRAEACSRNAAEALTWLSARLPTAETAAVLLGFAMLAAGVAVLGPSAWARYTEHVVRIQVADAIIAVRWLQSSIEQDLIEGRPPPASAKGAVIAGKGAQVIDAVDVSPASGRLRVGFADSLPELAGKWILLAPLSDGRHGLRWMCVPVDIPTKYLPKACGGN